MTNIQAVLYALAKDLLLLQSLVCVLIYQENKTLLAEIGQSFLCYMVVCHAMA